MLLGLVPRSSPVAPLPPVAATSGGGEGGVCPVRRGDRRAVLLRRGLVEDWQQLEGLVRHRLEVDHGVSAVAVVRVEDEVTVKISGGFRYRYRYR